MEQQETTPQYAGLSGGIVVRLEHVAGRWKAAVEAAVQFEEALKGMLSAAGTLVGEVGWNSRFFWSHLLYSHSHSAKTSLSADKEVIATLTTCSGVIASDNPNRLASVGLAEFKDGVAVLTEPSVTGYRFGQQFVAPMAKVTAARNALWNAIEAARKSTLNSQLIDDYEK